MIVICRLSELRLERHDMYIAGSDRQCIYVTHTMSGLSAGLWTVVAIKCYGDNMSLPYGTSLCFDKLMCQWL